MEPNGLSELDTELHTSQQAATARFFQEVNMFCTVGGLEGGAEEGCYLFSLLSEEHFCEECSAGGGVTCAAFANPDCLARAMIDKLFCGDTSDL